MKQKEENNISVFKKLWFILRDKLFVVFLLLGIFFSVYWDLENQIQEEEKLDNSFNSNTFCDNSQKLYDECLNYYSPNPNSREMQYCKDKVELYNNDCLRGNKSK